MLESEDPQDIVVMVCNECKTSFVPTNSRQKYCSLLCKQRNWKAKNSNRYRTTDLPTGTTGAIAELRVAADLLNKGFEVFRAVSQACSCDLVLHKNKQLLRVEVRTGWKREDASIGCCFRAKDAERSDILAIYVANDDSITYKPSLE